MLLNSQGKPITELSDLALDIDGNTGGIGVFAREHPQVIDAALPDYDVTTRREIIYRAGNALSEFGVNLIKMPSEVLMLLGATAAAKTPINRRQAFAALAGLAAVAAGYAKNAESQDKTEFSGYDTPRSLHWPTGSHITAQDYPPMTSAIAADVPAGWDRSTSQGLTGGIDFSAKRDGSTKVVPAAIGDVSEAEYSSYSGWTVLMRHGLGFVTQYSHLKNINERILERTKNIKDRPTLTLGYRELILTPNDEIGYAGNTGTGAKGFYHLWFGLLVPPYIKPNNSIILSRGGKAHSTDPARFAEYCKVGKKIGNELVRICNFSVNYRQTEEFDTALWEKDREFRIFLGGLRQELSMSIPEFQSLMRTVLYYEHILLIEDKLKERFDGRLSSSSADNYLEKLHGFKQFSLRGPILTAPFESPKPRYQR